MTVTTPIYKRDSAGKLRVWYAEIDANCYRTTAGVHNGNLVTSAWTTCAGKQGRSNIQQAAFEANAEEQKKLKREYRRTLAELDAVPPSPMLAQDYAKLKGSVFGAGRVFCQPKLDGIRALISRHGAFSREYQPHHNVDHILAALAPVFLADPDMILDGELYNHDLKDDFGAISSVVRKKSPTSTERIKAANILQFHVYDQINARHPNSPFSVRSDDLKLFAGGPVVLVETMEVTDQDLLDHQYGKYLERGYEGQMVRLDAPYEVDKRSSSLLKRKEFITAEFPLVDIEEGTGNWAGYAKRVVFRLPDGRECGGGIRGNQEQMKKLLLGSVDMLQNDSTVTIRHFTPTPDGMPRFPVATDFHFGGRKD